MQTQLRVGVARQGRLVDERWLPPGHAVSLGGRFTNQPEFRSIDDTGGSLRAHPTRTGTRLDVPPGVVGEWCDAEGTVQPLDGRQAVDVTLSRGGRAWLRVGDSVLYLQQAVRPPPPPRTALPLGVTVGRRPLDRRLATAFATMSVVIAIAVLVAVRRPGPMPGIDPVAPPPARPFVLPPPKVEPPPVRVEVGEVPRPARSPAGEPRPAAPGREVREAMRRRVSKMLGGEAVGTILAPGRADLPSITFAGVPSIDPLQRGPRVLPGPAHGPITDLNLGPAGPGAPRPVVAIVERPRDPPPTFVPDPPPPTIDPPEGDDDAARVYAFVRQRLGQLRNCHEKRMRRLGAPLGGRVTLAFTVDAGGRLSAIELGEGTLHDDELDACLVGTLRAWRVTPPPSREVDVELPVVFSAAR